MKSNAPYHDKGRWNAAWSWPTACEQVGLKKSELTKAYVCPFGDDSYAGI
jgi:hypothetical protein